LGDILIHPLAITFSDIVVEGNRSPVTYEIDKKVVDPDQMQTVVSGNAADILANVPSVQVDIEGNVSLRGSQNFTVLIDGRPSLLDAQDALQSISASSIDKIELITNPTAKYDAEGTAGIINIITKKDLGSDLNGIVNANAGMYDTYGGDILINYQDGFKANIGLEYNQRYFPGDRTQNSVYYLEDETSFINTNGDVKRGRTGYEGRGGIEFPLGDFDILNLGFRIGYRKGNMTSDQNYAEFSSSNPIVTSYLGKTDRYREGNFYSINSNYTHNFNPSGHQLLAEFIYGYRDSDELTTTSEFSNDGLQFGGRESAEYGPSTDYRWKLDYSLPFAENNKFETGYQGEIDNSDEYTDLYDYNPDTGEYEIQSEFSNLTKYYNNQQSLYAMYSDIFLNTNLQAGIRAEYTYRTIDIPWISESFTIDRVDYFPSFHASYKFSPISTAMASYSRRINQPRGWALEPFPTWIDANNVRIGNPELIPEFINSFEAGVQSALYDISVTAEIYYRSTENKIEPIRTAIENDVTLTTFDNVGNDYSFGAELMLIFDPFSFWNLNFTGNIFNYKIEGVILDEPYSNESFNWQSRMSNTFKLWSSTQIQLNTSYNSPTVTAQGEWAGYFSSDLAIRQEIFPKILAVTLQIRDVLGTAKREYTSTGTNLYNYNYFDMSTPMLTLNLRYTFNNYKPKREGRGEGGSDFGGGDEF
jgi:outer membrane receptor protein involved in Fe transport